MAFPLLRAKKHNVVFVLRSSPVSLLRLGEAMDSATKSKCFHVCYKTRKSDEQRQFYVGSAAKKKTNFQNQVFCKFAG